jgi:polyhydroxybutyrate depolymerase
LLIVLHGSGGSAQAVRHASGLDSVGDARGFFVAYPNGSKGRFGLHASDWNAGTCCGAAARDRVDDIGFLHALIERVSAQLPVDRHRIYVAGFSDGGRMAYRAACDLASEIAAIAVVSGSLMTEQCTPARSVSVVAFHGTSDDDVPFNDRSLVEPSPTTPQLASALPPSIRFWAAANGCRNATSRRESPHVTRTALTTCSGADVWFYAIEGGVHGWPGEPDGTGSQPPMNELSATGVMVRFLLRHALE